MTIIPFLANPADMTKRIPKNIMQRKFIMFDITLLVQLIKKTLVILYLDDSAQVLCLLNSFGNN